MSSTRTRHRVTTTHAKKELEYMPEPASRQQGKKYGSCVVCNERVYGEDNYRVVEEGYCHTSCLVETRIL